MNITDQEFDKLISKALTTEEAQYYQKLAKPSIFELAGETFTGRYKALSYLAFFYTLVFTIFTFYAFYQVYLATELKDIVLWGGGAIIGLIATSALKIWFWMQMNNNQILREIKRLELQISALAQHSVKESR